jgi:hypothetical protein
VSLTTLTSLFDSLIAQFVTFIAFRWECATISVGRQVKKALAYEQQIDRLQQQDLCG